MIVIWRPRCGCLDCVVKSGALESCHPCGCQRYRARSGLLVCLLARHFSDSDMLRKLGASAAWNRGRDIAVLLVCSVCANATRCGKSWFVVSEFCGSRFPSSPQAVVRVLPGQVSHQALGSVLRRVAGNVGGCTRGEVDACAVLACVMQ